MFLRSALFGALASVTAAETIHGVVAFTRHGDRTTRIFPGYSLTSLGAQQAYNSGEFYRERYVAADAESRIAGIEPEKVDPLEIWASAPNQGLLFQTAVNFLQGLYPPLLDLETNLAVESLANGSDSVAPLDGYQFILIEGQPDTNPDTIWVKGDDDCPAHIAAQETYLDTAEYLEVRNETDDFYSRFVPLLGSILGDDGVSYENAYDVFDSMNVASIHNGSVAEDIEPAELAQLRYLADQWEFNMNFNASEPARMIGGKAFIGGLLRQMNETVAAGGRSKKFQLFSGSYDTFLSFFGLTDLTLADSDFFGLPDYASTMAFEMFTDDGDVDSPAEFPREDQVDDDLRVRFLFRNGTDDGAPLNAFPLFGGDNLALPYGQFRERMMDIGISSVQEWCAVCGSSQNFCLAPDDTVQGSSGSDTVDSGGQSRSSGLSNAAAGGIGAAVTLIAVALVITLAWVYIRIRRGKKAAAVRESDEKRSGSDSDAAV